VSLANEDNGALRQVGGVASDFPEELYNDSLMDGDACLFFVFLFPSCLCYGTDRFMGLRSGYGMGYQGKGIRSEVQDQRANKRDSLKNIFRNQEL
jgi:hypothetical protein